MPNLSNVKDKLAKLVDDYNEKANILGQNEARTRQYLIDPFWEALGWDMRNSDHVDVESNVQSDELDLTDEERAGTKRADYTFLHSYNKTAFVVEAKKPKVSLRDEKVINQLKRYGFTLGIDIGILHDFEEFRAFDTAFPVTPRPEVNLIKEFDIGYEQYPDLADKLLETFGREAVLGGSIQRLVGRVRKGKSTIPVDKHFLDMLKGWRERLAIGLANQNPAYSIQDINEYVGRILNRIIFLRVIEERHALTGKPLEGAWNDYRRYSDVGAKIKLYEQLKPFFLEMNEIFNGVLFKPTDWDEMKVPDPPVYDMLREIYNPLVPYDFKVLQIELLGTIYERFLGEVVVRENDEVKIEVKPEVRKAGGVYYTPKYIVDYIVEQTVGKLIEGKTPEQIAKIKILDPACGSGSFLIGAYERLMKYHLEWFKKHPKKIKRGVGRADAYIDGDNNWRLGFHVKQQILVNNIYGVDIDGRAVEVTMLSLYLKLMEDETYLTLEGMKYLPDLSGNIKCGNSLIGNDIRDMDI
ncbi:MAG: DNA methyltransferase, partial [bacterium]